MPILNDLYYVDDNLGNPELPPLVLIHGEGLDQRVWPAAFRRLPGRRVITLDLPAHGKSGGTAEQSVEGLAGMVLDLLLGIGVYTAVYAGHSLGAAVALHIAAYAPEHAAAVAVINGGAHLGVPAELADLFAVSSTHPLAMRLLGERLLPPSARPEEIERWLARMRELRPSALMGDWRAAATFDLRHETYRITQPVWVAAGMEDRLVPLAAGNFLAGQLPQAKLKLFPGAGHLLPFEQPAAVLDGLRAFLQSTEPQHIEIEARGLDVRVPVGRKVKGRE
jgi:3-oxoadipate enol-lactonase/4-carboxymuconolactone decarboxylase